MKERDERDMEIEELQKQLRGALAPMGDAELRRDLWPQMLKKMEQTPTSAQWAGVAWFDWLLLALSGGAVVFFPALIPALLYHL